MSKRNESEYSLLEQQLSDQRKLFEIERERVSYLTTYFGTVVNSMLAAMIITDEDLLITEVNAETERLLGRPRSELELTPLSQWIDHPLLRDLEEGGDLSSFSNVQAEVVMRARENEQIPVYVTLSPLTFASGEVEGLVCIAKDLTERKLLEQKLMQAQKLESVGQLAAGIAHEINTPIQYVRDNMVFLGEEFRNLTDFIRYLQESIGSPAAGEEIEAKAKAIDLEYLLAEIPIAIQQTREGADVVAHIVKSMKEFSHPGNASKTSVDLNQALESSTTVSRNEWKYVAELQLDLDPDLPLVQCFPSEINQVFLNIIVNAAQAIRSSRSDQEEALGTISISTRKQEGGVEIRIKDSGPGIPDEIKDKVFDPFFTTKDVGEGSGQGLNFAYNTIVERHGGSLSFDSTIGSGTTFIIQLPLTIEGGE